MNQLQTQTDTSDIITVIIAARNEEALITACLTALLTQSDAAGPVEVIVAANACTDQTVNVAQQQTQAFADKGWSLVVLDLADGGKLGALNAADAQARGGCRIYLDADVICSPELLGQIRQVLRNDAGLYATGTLVVAPAQTAGDPRLCAHLDAAALCEIRRCGGRVFRGQRCRSRPLGRFP
uniref:Glycosyltransferase n=1 Tax=Yoonia rhodophyticola TaxID=3137370 RepID=A0AAN0MCU6_9RHOB